MLILPKLVTVKGMEQFKLDKIISILAWKPGRRLSYLRVTAKIKGGSSWELENEDQSPAVASRNALSFRLREGCRSFRSALASI